MDTLFVVQGEYAAATLDHSAQSYMMMLRSFCPQFLDGVVEMPVGRADGEDISSVVDRKREDTRRRFARLVPVGTIPFVQAFLSWQRSTGAHPDADAAMTPLEVPESLRRFVSRPYAIVCGSDLPEGRIDGNRWFMKDASHLKRWAVPMANHSIEHGVDRDGTLYVVSGRVEFASEWRVFVHGDEVLSANFYMGNPLAFPSRETVSEMVRAYAESGEHPSAYTLDIGVREVAGRIVTEPLEVHPFAACGLYGFFDRDVPAMLSEGYEWYASGASARHGVVAESVDEAEGRLGTPIVMRG